MGASTFGSGSISGLHSRLLTSPTSLVGSGALSTDFLSNFTLSHDPMSEVGKQSYKSRFAAGRHNPRLAAALSTEAARVTLSEFLHLASSSNVQTRAFI